MRRTTLAATALAAAAMAAAGCGGGGGESGSTSAATDTSPVVGNAEAGKAVFLGASGCGGCHTLADAGTKSAVASNLDETRPNAARVREVVEDGEEMMPSYRNQLSEQEIADVVAYVVAAAGR